MATNETTITVTLTVDGDPARMAVLLADYLTNPQCPFAEDYGYGAWGGWDGPFVAGVRVTMPDGSEVTSTGWPTKDEMVGES